MRQMNIAPIEERRMNFENSMAGHMISEYIWAVIAASIAGFMLLFVLAS